MSLITYYDRCKIGWLLGMKMVRFGLFGFLLVIICFPLNYVLVEFVHLTKPVAYAFVISINLILGFVFNRNFVFEDTESTVSLPLALYVMAFFGIRGADWGFYIFQVKWLGVYYPIAQSINLFVFFIIKYLIYGLIMTKGKGERRDISRI